MHRLIIGASLALCLASAGCNLFVTGVNNLCYETRLNVAEHYDDCRYVALAEEAWASARGKCGANGESPDFAHGFKDGFADYMKFGGNGEPPALPPKHYQGVHYQTPKGYKLIEAWYAGFREGAAAARVSGLRQYEMLPIKGLVGGPGHPLAPGSPILLPPVPSAAAFPPDTGPAPEIAPSPTLVEPTPTPPREAPKRPEPIPAPRDELKRPPAPDLPPPMPPELSRGRLNLLPPVPAATEPTVPAPALLTPPPAAPALPPPPVPMTRRPADRIAPPNIVDENVTPASAVEITVPTVPAPPPPVPMTRRPIERTAPPKTIDENATPTPAGDITVPTVPAPPPPVPMTRRPVERTAPPKIIDENATRAPAGDITVPTVPAPPPPVPMTRRPAERIAPPRIIDENVTPVPAVTIIEGPGGPNDLPPQPGAPVPPRFGVPGSSPPARIVEGDGAGSRP